MVSIIVKKLRTIDIHPVQVDAREGSNRHERRRLEAVSHNFRGFGKRRTAFWKDQKRKKRIASAKSRKQNITK